MPASLLRRKPVSVRSWSDGESSLDSLHMLDSPDATTISTNSNRSSMLFSADGASQFAGSTSAGHDLANVHVRLSGKPEQPPGHLEFVALQQELARFSSRTGPTKANILRLTLLPFLRQRQFELLPNSAEIAFRVAVLEAWWSKLLADVHTKDHAQMVPGSDRAAYYEAISGIISRPEWLSLPIHYASMLAETVAALVPKIAVPSLPVALGAFAGKVMAYAYYHSPGLAPVLLYLLRPNQAAVNRLVERTVISETDAPLETMRSVFPGHLQGLIGLKTVATARPRLPKQFGDLYGPWCRHWNPASGLFASFFKHYYSLLANLLPPETDTWLHAHMAAPGLFLIQGVLVSYLDHIVQSSQAQPQVASAPASAAASPAASPAPKPVSPARTVLGRRDSMSSLGGSPVDNDDELPRSPVRKSGGTGAPQVPLSPPPARRAAPMTPPTSPTSPSGSPNALSSGGPCLRVDRLRLFTCLREVLHSDPSCVPFYRPFCLQFDRLVQTVAASVSVYQINSSVKLCDFVEEWISCVTLSHPRSALQVQANKNGAVDWGFWAHVVGRMTSSENSYSVIRAFSLLFNIWHHLPRQQPRDSSPDSVFGTAQLQAGLASLSDSVFVPTSEDVMWDVTEWLLSPDMWHRYFCHWNSLVRSYFHRLICFRVASVGPKDDWICDVDAAKYYTESRRLLALRLAETYGRCLGLISQSNASPELLPSLPLPNRAFVVGSNAAAQVQPQTEVQRVYLFDIFDNAAYYADQQAAKAPLTPRLPSSAASTMSEVSVDSVRSDMASWGGKNGVLGASDANSTPTKPSSLNRTFSLFKKLLPGDQDPSDSARKGGAETGSEIKAAKRGGLKRTKSKRKVSAKDFKFTDPAAIPSPWQLQEIRPEMTRPSTRFNLAGADKAFSGETATLATPFMPFESIVRSEPIVRADNDPDYDSDLALWNYGARSLAEWNATAVLFENFARKQRSEVASPRVDDLVMPFMVAEIPWRAVG